MADQVNGLDGERPPTRKERAELTRRRILVAAHQEIARRGYHGMTMQAVADAAGVAVQTVYLGFRTKAQLLAALLTAAVRDGMGEDGGRVPIDDTAWFREVAAARTSEEVLRRFVLRGVELHVQVAPVHEAARIGALTDPDVVEVFDTAESWRLADYRHVVGLLRDRGGLRSDLGVDRATQVLATLYGPRVYLSMTSQFGWTPQEFGEWAVDALGRVLLEPRPSGA